VFLILKAGRLSPKKC